MWNFSFWWWFQILIIFQTETLNLEIIITVLKIHIYSIMIFKNVMHSGKFKYLFKKIQEIHSKIHLHVKIIFVRKDLQSFSKIILLVPNYKFWPYFYMDYTFYSVFFLNVDFFHNGYSYERLLIKAWIKVICSRS